MNNVVITYIIVVILVIFSALFSGLTLGLLGLNTFELRRKMEIGDKNAKKIYPLRKKGNQLLCTLLLGNVAVNSVLAVFLGSITAGVAAAILSTALIVIFGEIIPQALFSRYALPMGSRMVWLVNIFFYLLWPVTYPLAFALDKVLGGETPSEVSKKELRLFLEEQHKLNGATIDETEFQIIEKSLKFSEKSVKQIMTPRVNMYSLSEDDELNLDLLMHIRQHGHSRIPVYKDDIDHIEGILYTKDLITIDPDGGMHVKNVMRTKRTFVKETDKLDTIFEQFKNQRVHIFIVKDEFDGVAGIVTLEDVIEEVLGEIVDEFDKRIDMRSPTHPKNGS